MKTIVLPLNCLASANGPLLLIKKGEMFRSRCSWWTRRSRVTSTSRALIFPPPTGRAEKLFVDKPKTDQSCCCFISPDSSCVDMEEEKEVTETRSTKEDMRKKWKKKKRYIFFTGPFFFFLSRGSRVDWWSASQLWCAYRVVTLGLLFLLRIFISFALLPPKKWRIGSRRP